MAHLNFNHKHTKPFNHHIPINQSFYLIIINNKLFYLRSTFEAYYHSLKTLNLILKILICKFGLKLNIIYILKLVLNLITIYLIVLNYIRIYHLILILLMNILLD